MFLKNALASAQRKIPLLRVALRTFVRNRNFRRHFKNDGITALARND